MYSVAAENMMQQRQLMYYSIWQIILLLLKVIESLAYSSQAPYDYTVTCMKGHTYPAYVEMLSLAFAPFVDLAMKHTCTIVD